MQLSRRSEGPSSETLANHSRCCLKPVIDTQVQWITEAIASTGDADSAGRGGSALGHKTFEARQGSEDAWLELCRNLAAGTLFTEANS